MSSPAGVFYEDPVRLHRRFFGDCHLSPVGSSFIGVGGYCSVWPFLHATQPLGVPAVISLAFWGGVWGILFELIHNRFPRGGGYWLTAFLFGAISRAAAQGPPHRRLATSSADNGFYD